MANRLCRSSPGFSLGQSLSRDWLCYSMDCSAPGFPIHHQLLGLAQTHVHWVGDAIQPSHSLSSPSPPTFNHSQHQSLFQWVSYLHQVARVLEFRLQHQSFQWIFRTDIILDGLVGSPYSPRDSQESCPTPQFKSIDSLTLSFIYSPVLTFIHNYWKNSTFVFAIRVMSSAYVRLLIFLQTILILACASSSLAFNMMYSAYKLNNQGDDIRPWCTPFLIWNNSVVPCPVLALASWPAHRFLRRQVRLKKKKSRIRRKIRWSGISISWRIVHSLLRSTQSKALV